MVDPLKTKCEHKHLSHKLEGGISFSICRGCEEIFCKFPQVILDSLRNWEISLKAVIVEKQMDTHPLKVPNQEKILDVYCEIKKMRDKLIACKGDA